MIIRRKLFSTDNTKDENLKDVGALAGAGAVAAGSYPALAKTNKLLGLYNLRGGDNDPKLVSEMLNDTKGKKIGIIVDRRLGNNAYTKFRSSSKDFFEQLNTKDPKLKKELAKYLGVSESQLPKLADRNYLISIGPKHLTETPEVVAHELGHALNNDAKNLYGKADSIRSKGIYEYLNGNGGKQKVSSGIHFLNGLHSGIKKEKDKSEGKKTSAINKYKTVALPLLTSLPILAGEAGASIKGYKLMKKAGYSKEALSRARKNLSKAWGTYTAYPAANLLSGGAGEVAGHVVGKHVYGNKKDRKNET